MEEGIEMGSEEENEVRDEGGRNGEMGKEKGEEGEEEENIVESQTHPDMVLTVPTPILEREVNEIVKLVKGIYPKELFLNGESNEEPLPY